MSVQSLIHGLKRQIKRSPWLFFYISRLQKTLKRSKIIAFLYPHILEMVARAVPSWIGLRAYLANYYAMTGEREKSLEIANAVLAGGGRTPSLLLNLQPIFHLQGLPEQARHLLQQAEGLKIDENRTGQLDRLNLRFFSPAVFDNIGHIAMMDCFLKGERLGLLPKQHNILIGPMERFSNPDYACYWGRYFTIIDHPETVALLQPLVRPLAQKLAMISYADGRMVDFVSFLRDVAVGWTAERPPLLELSAEDKVRGDALLRDLGVPKDAWIVGLHVRKTADSLRDLRNAEIETYHLAIDEIHRRGGWVLRMGDQAMPPATPRPGLIDYVHSGRRTPWMDVYIWACGRFFIGTGSGPCVAPITFGKQSVITNWVPLATRMHSSRDIMLPKQMWLEAEQRHLTIAERISDRYGHQEASAAMAAVGVRVDDNTPEQICAAVVEMMEMMDGAGAQIPAHAQLQRQADALADQARITPNRFARVFLEQYPELFRPLAAMPWN